MYHGVHVFVQVAVGHLLLYSLVASLQTIESSLGKCNERKLYFRSGGFFVSFRFGTDRSIYGFRATSMVTRSYVDFTTRNSSEGSVVWEARIRNRNRESMGRGTETSQRTRAKNSTVQ